MRRGFGRTVESSDKPKVRDYSCEWHGHLKSCFGLAVDR